MSKSNKLMGALQILAAAMRPAAKGGESEGVVLETFLKEMVANESLSAKQYDSVMAMDDEQKSMLKTLLDAMAIKAKEDAAEDETPPPEMTDAQKAAAAAQAAAPAAQVAANAKQGAEMKQLIDLVTNMGTQLKDLTTKVGALEANGGKTALEAVKRRDLIAALIANEDNVLEVNDLEALTTPVLMKLEEKLRPADYSGNGSFAANSGGRELTGDNAPLVVNTGFMLKKPPKKDPSEKGKQAA